MKTILITIMIMTSILSAETDTRVKDNRDRVQLNIEQLERERNAISKARDMERNLRDFNRYIGIKEDTRCTERICYLSR